MKAKLNFNWKKGWDKIDEAQGGYAETVYEYFNFVPSVPLLKSKVADVWYIGNLQKGERPLPGRIFYNEEIAKKEFENVKLFIESELASRHRFETMSKAQLNDWLNKFGRNEFVGESLYFDTAMRALQRESKKELEM